MPWFLLNIWKSQDLRKNRDAKKARSFDCRFSKGRLEIKDNPRFKNRISNQVPSKLAEAKVDRVSIRKPKMGWDTSSPTTNPTCRKCARKSMVIVLRE